jgi:hypothetical protein
MYVEIFSSISRSLVVRDAQLPPGGLHEVSATAHFETVLLFLICVSFWESHKLHWFRLWNGFLNLILCASRFKIIDKIKQHSLSLSNHTSQYSEWIHKVTEEIYLKKKNYGSVKQSFSGPESRGTHDHILLSHESRLPQPGGPGPRIYIPRAQGGPVMHPGTGFPFRHLLRLSGLRWRYSNPPPDGVNPLVTNWIAPIVFLITTLHGLSRKRCFE